MTLNKKLKVRREKVSEYILQGYSEKDISNILEVSRETIVRDVRVLKNESIRYLRMYPSLEYLFLYKLSVDKLQSYELQLNQLKENTTTENKIKIIRELQKNIGLQVKMLASPMLVHINQLLDYVDNKMAKTQSLQPPPGSIEQRNQNLSLQK